MRFIKSSYASYASYNYNEMKRPIGNSDERREYGRLKPTLGLNLFKLEFIQIFNYIFLLHY